MDQHRAALAHHPLDLARLPAPTGASLAGEIVYALTFAGLTTPEAVTAALAPGFGAWNPDLWLHSRHVAKYAAALAGQLSLSPAVTNAVRVAGLLHDIGKVFVPEDVLHKPGPMTADEYALMRLHPARGAQMLIAAAAPATIVEAVRDHHERWGGGGYTTGRAGAAISIGGRILAVADALDAILCDRAYSRGKSLPWALAEIARCAGGQFDPAVVAALERVVVVRGTGFFHGPARVIPLHETRAWRRRNGVALTS